MLLVCLPGFAGARRGPILLIDTMQQPLLHVGGGGITTRYRRVKGPNDFGGDMWMWGLRGFGGQLSDPKIGGMFNFGELRGNYHRLQIRTAALTIENGFKPDPRFKWRAQFGGGRYEFNSLLNGYQLFFGNFTFLEPMAVGVLPLSHHIVLEISAGYTFANATQIRLGGLFLQAELLFGRF